MSHLQEVFEFDVSAEDIVRSLRYLREHSAVAEDPDDVNFCLHCAVARAATRRLGEGAKAGMSFAGNWPWLEASDGRTFIMRERGERDGQSLNQWMKRHDDDCWPENEGSTVEPITIVAEGYWQEPREEKDV